MILDSLQDWLNCLVFDTLKSNLKDKKMEKQLKMRIESYTQRCIQQFESIRHDEEYDLQAVMDFLNNSNDINNYVYGTSYEVRSRSRNTIISKAKSVANTSNDAALKNVESFVNKTLEIICDFYKEYIDKDMLIATRIISDELIPELDKISSTLNRIESCNAQNTQLGLTDSDINKAKNGDNSAINLKLSNFQSVVSTLHPVKGYENKILNGRIISAPVSSEANLNPPVIKAKGKAKLGDEEITEINDDVLDYSSIIYRRK